MGTEPAWARAGQGSTRGGGEGTPQPRRQHARLRLCPPQPWNPHFPHPGPLPEGTARAEGLREGRLWPPTPASVAGSVGTAPPISHRGFAPRKVPSVSWSQATLPLPAGAESTSRPPWGSLVWAQPGCPPPTPSPLLPSPSPLVSWSAASALPSPAPPSPPATCGLQRGEGTGVWELQGSGLSTTSTALSWSRAWCALSGWEGGPKPKQSGVWGRVGQAFLGQGGGGARVFFLRVTINSDSILQPSQPVYRDINRAKAIRTKFANDIVLTQMLFISESPSPILCKQVDITPFSSPPSWPLSRIQTLPSPHRR